MPAITRRVFLSAGSGIALAILSGPWAEAGTVDGDDKGSKEKKDGKEKKGSKTDKADAPPSRPRIHTRDEWDAAAPKSKAVVLDTPPDRLVIHHTATANTRDVSLEAAFRLSRAIQRYHMRRNGWADIGEQFTVSRGGHIMEGRNRTLPAIAQGGNVVGAQAAGHNRHTLGIETEGTYTTELPPTDQLDSLTALLAWLCSTYRLDPEEAIIGHRDLNATACPGDRLYEYLPELRAGVARRLGDRLPDGERPDPGEPEEPEDQDKSQADR
ncbi:peptidoglycan recognition protein family protein [Sphaerimonospora sp. CA-214678]|uniref:peptidoglycan recognition protein family protein n=1 Tax=Sphaerimonospora sp. CA-214678 TaxID=3240029 RepID=UPI003D9334F1